MRKWLCAWILDLLANMLARNLTLEVSNSEGLIPRLYVIGIELCEIIAVGFLCYGWTSLLTILFSGHVAMKLLLWPSRKFFKLPTPFNESFPV